MAAVRERKRQHMTTGLTLDSFKKFMQQMGCTGLADLSSRLFQTFIYPPNMDAANILQQPSTRVTFEEFVNGCKCALSYRNPGKRIRSIFNFYDIDRTGCIDRGQLHRGLKHAPSIELQRDPELRQNKVLSLVKKIWIAAEASAVDTLSSKDFCRLAKQFPELTELFDLGL